MINSLIENIQRKRLNAIDEAKAFKAYVSDFGWGGVSDLAKRIGKSASYVTKRIKLLNLSSDVLDSITNSKLNSSIAEELFSIKDKGKQSILANLIIDRSLSLRRSRKLLNKFNRKDVDHDTYHPKDHIDHVRNHLCPRSNMHMFQRLIKCSMRKKCISS
jgi:ParB family transcriptional regulator, chromosome partitioning protein